MKTKRLDSLDALIEKQADVYQALEEGTMELKHAAELNNTAGKMLSAAKLKLAYSIARNEHPNIPFFGYTGESKDAKTIPSTKAIKNKASQKS